MSEAPVYLVKSTYKQSGATSPHDPTNQLISKDRNNHLPVQISRKDGQTLGILGPVKANLRPENGPFGPT